MHYINWFSNVKPFLNFWDAIIWSSHTHTHTHTCFPTYVLFVFFIVLSTCCLEPRRNFKAQTKLRHVKIFSLKQFYHFSSLHSNLWNLPIAYKMPTVCSKAYTTLQLAPVYLLLPVWKCYDMVLCIVSDYMFFKYIMHFYTCLCYFFCLNGFLLYPGK